MIDAMTGRGETVNDTVATQVRTDPASLEMRERARTEGISTIWDRYEALGTQCKVGELGICCTVCHLGPCNLGLPGSKRPKVGVCGATIDTVAARRLARDMAAGSAAHPDHGRSLGHLLLPAARRGGPGEQIAGAVAQACLAQFALQDDGLVFAGRAPAKQREQWRALDIAPRGVD